MQNQWDDLEKSISASFEDIEVQPDYTTRLVEKLHQKTPLERKRNFVPSLSLIAAGLFIMLLGATNLQSKWVNFEYHLRTQAIIMQFQYTDTITHIKNLGE